MQNALQFSPASWQCYTLKMGMTLSNPQPSQQQNSGHAEVAGAVCTKKSPREQFPPLQMSQVCVNLLTTGQSAAAATPQLSQVRVWLRQHSSVSLSSICDLYHCGVQLD